MQKILTAMVLAGLALGAQASGDDAQALDRARNVLDHFVNEVRTLQADFAQSLVDVDGIVIEESLGRLIIRKPGQFLWHYSEPYEQLLLADGNDLWSYDVDLEQVVIKPQDEVLVSTPALLLGGSANALADFTIIEAVTHNSTFWIRLRPTQEDAGFTALELGFDDEQLSRMMFYDSLGQTTLIALRDVVINAPVADTVFALDIPPGVDIVGEPAAAAGP